MVSCVALLSGAAVYGQGGLKQADADNMTAFYEWVLEVKFTPEQRVRFQQYLDKDMKEHPTTAPANLKTIVDTWSQIKQSSEEVRRKTRATFLGDYLPELKKSRDESDVFLLGIYKAAHGGRDTFTDLDEARGNVADKSDLNAASGDSVEVSLTGKWERYTGSGSITDGTGKTKYGNGTTYTFEFLPGGAVQYTVVEKTLSIMGCKIESNNTARGKFSVSGGKLSMNLGTMTMVGTDSCDSKGNYKKSEPAGDLTVTFRIKQSDSVLRPDKPMLLCFDGDGGEACYEKVNR